MSQAAGLQTYLSRARIAPEVFQLRPDYRALLIAIEGIKPASSDEESEARLREAEESARERLAKKPVTELEHIASWREAYKGFGAKPTKYRNSLEALTRRAEAGLPRVNRLTDIYNALSVKHQIPFGGEDLDKYTGPPKLIVSNGTEDFTTTANGETVIERHEAGEVVWCDDAGVTCRRWNWRQGPRTALSDSSSRVLFILDALAPVSDEELHVTADELVQAISSNSPDVQTARRLLSSEQ
ncbi:hypothetical protein KC367_g8644 [Hortaea werneckii]|nr:hypothetical protein KC367_g8644 [Hortaea werneckii]